MGFLRFRLSTMLLSLLTLAVSLGWFVDHFALARCRIVGEWYYPTSDHAVLGYSTHLTIRRDGTFEKRQQYRAGCDVFAGTYRWTESGTLIFHITKKTVNHGIPALAPRVETLDAYDECRCSVDHSGYLLICRVSGKLPAGGRLGPFADIGLRWETYNQAALK